MTTVIDVANYALRHFNRISTMKLQKLVFYSQAYHLVVQHEPLFSERIEAWVNGPVVPDLFRLHKGEYTIPFDYLEPYSQYELTEQERRSVDHVIAKIGERSGASLSELTHSEDPWLKARGDAAPDAVIHSRISKESIVDFYSSKSCKNPIFA